MYLQGTSYCTLNEHYLHFLWRTKRIPFHQLRLSNGADFQLVSTGTYNAFESGPDFSCAQIIIDGLQWVGNVEIHLRSSDWYAHGHQHDPAYQNVILHVVLIHDKEVLVKGQILPTLELKSIIDFAHLQHHKPQKRSAIPCASLVRAQKNLPFFSIAATTLPQRLARKSETKGPALGTSEWFYTLLARSFGAQVNAVPFELITLQVPWTQLLEMDSQQRFIAIIQASGLYPALSNQDSMLENSALEPFWWKRKGQHAPAQPEKRLVQFAALVSYLPDALSFVHLDSPSMVKYFSELLQTAFSQYGILHHIKKSFLLNTILINAVAPLLYHHKRHTTALALVQSLGPEDNHITRLFKDMGVSARNAGESQMLIELHTQFCTAKKCLNCAVGTQILG